MSASKVLNPFDTVCNFNCFKIQSSNFFKKDTLGPPYSEHSCSRGI